MNSLLKYSVMHLTTFCHGYVKLPISIFQYFFKNLKINSDDSSRWSRVKPDAALRSVRVADINQVLKENTKMTQEKQGTDHRHDGWPFPRTPLQVGDCGGAINTKHEG